MTHTTENKPPKRSFFQKIFAGSFFLLPLFFSIIVLAFALLDAILLIWLPIGNWVFWALFAANASLFALSCAAPLLIIKFTRHSPLKAVMSKVFRVILVHEVFVEKIDSKMLPQGESPSPHSVQSA